MAFTDYKNMFKFWAKFNQEKIHLLIYHSLDVAAVSYVWLENNPSLRKQMQNLLNITCENKLLSFIPFLASLHDIGKISHGFQLKSSYAIKELNPPINKKIFYERFDHGAFGAYWLIKNLKIISDYNSINKSERLSLESFFLSTCIHHGRYYQSSEYTRSPQTAKEYVNELDENLNIIRFDFIKALKDIFKVSHLILNTNNFRAVSVFIAGFISICDWMGSNTDYFDFLSKEQSISEYYDNAKVKAKKVLEKNGLLQSFDKIDLNDSNKLFAFDLRPIQKSIKELPSKYGMVIIEAPTGEGKTEAAYLRLMKLISDLDVQGAYFALPTRATANALYDRTKDDFLNKLLLSGRINLELSHSSSWIKESYKSTFEQEQIDIDNANEKLEGASVVSSEWFHSAKRTLLSAFGIGTIDQAMMAALSVRHFFVRMFGLCKGAVVFDEIHAYDTYMDTIIFRLIEWLGANNVPVVLLSATLPLTKKKEFIKYYSGKEHELTSQDYPLITGVSKDNVKEIGGMDAAIKRKIKLEYSLSDDFKALIELIKTKISDGGCLCVITNTVRRCQDIYQEIKDNLQDGVEAIAFHSRFTLYDRNNIENDLISKFGKKGKRPVKAIVVATQVIEQSLDLDFDYMITDIAPVDLIIQRVGRLHRHNNSRPNGLEKPQVTILIDKQEPGFYIYPNTIILRTILALQKKAYLETPNETRSIVDFVYPENDLLEEMDYDLVLGNINLSFDKEVISKWNKKYSDEKSESERIAKGFYLPDPRENERMKINDFAEEDDKSFGKIRATTRLGDDSEEVILLQLIEDSLQTAAGENIFSYVNGNLTTPKDFMKAYEIKSLFLSQMSISKKKLIHIDDYREKDLEKQVEKIIKKTPAFKHTGVLILSSNNNIYYNREMGLVIDK